MGKPEGKGSLPLPGGVTFRRMETSSPQAISAALTEILRDDLNVDLSRVTRDSRLIDDVGLDSVAFAVGMVAIEDKIGVALSEEDLLTCDTVGDLENAILAKVPAEQ
ncbi:acyl carrier protein [Mycobacterium sp. SMC-4]|uniref:acyl carrier protein n=1 Tax=Mycobacterium sp. SMC-4 TaxID=2857059 RepID=UPI003D08EE2A